MAESRNGFEIMATNAVLNSEEVITPVAETDLITFRKSSIHGTGGFARKPIAKGARMIEYVGEAMDKAESARRCEANNEYIFTLNDHMDIDGNVAWNPARFLNHSCAPNAEAEIEGDRIWIIALRDLAPGEEITFNYGFDLDDYREYPCKCGAPNCVGFIIAEEYFEQLRTQKELTTPVPGA